MTPEGRPWWARLALAALVGSAVVPLVAAGLRSALWLLLAVAGVALTAVGVWWTLAHTGPLRLLGALLSVAAPLTVLGLYSSYGLLWPAVAAFVLWLVAHAAGHAALVPEDDDVTGQWRRPAPAPRHPWIVMNPLSGGGKVDRFGLAERARAAGAEVVLLEPGAHQDVAALARRAVAEGADLLGVAGGDGTQALVAEVAARHGLPFLAIPAGTRNHFALDLGLDRRDPSTALQALSDGVEFRVDLGYAAGRAFVNNASFGTYAAVVAEPEYRGHKLQTAFRSLPVLLTGPRAPRLEVRAGDHHLGGLQALLVSNNPYLRAVDAGRPGRRRSLASGLLGVVCVRVDDTAQAARLVRGDRSRGLTRLTAREVVVAGGGDGTLAAGIDGEHVTLPAPVVCRIAPGALRVRVPRDRPGHPAGGPPVDWPEVTRLALDRTGARSTAAWAARGRHDHHGTRWWPMVRSGP
ncbi:diacylglycerol/lipid kinase family protein [Streptomyces collinus]|uniref:diacylglycerol/lipid kinase family protein n=1 Tax=Streptomyces collinus TaxID=42684 RepID=UPI0036869CF6